MPSGRLDWIKLRQCKIQTSARRTKSNGPHPGWLMQRPQHHTPCSLTQTRRKWHLLPSGVQHLHTEAWSATCNPGQPKLTKSCYSGNGTVCMRPAAGWQPCSAVESMEQCCKTDETLHFATWSRGQHLVQHLVCWHMERQGGPRMARALEIITCSLQQLPAGNRKGLPCFLCAMGTSKVL